MSNGPFAYLEDFTRDLLYELLKDYARDNLTSEEEDYSDVIRTVNDEPSLLFTDDEGHTFKITVRID